MRTARARRSSSIPPGLKHKDLIGIPWMLAFALRADGWYLRQEIIWHKPNPMPESVSDRCTKAHESLFLLSKSPTYYCDMAAIREPAAGLNNYPPQGGPVPGAPRQSRKRGEFAGKTNALPGREAFRAVAEERNRRSVWTVPTSPYGGAHFAVYPEELIEPCILAGAPAGGIVLDPFFGSGTTGAVAQRLGRRWIGCELQADYLPLQAQRTQQRGLILDAEDGGATPSVQSPTRTMNLGDCEKCRTTPTPSVSDSARCNKKQTT